MLQSPNTFIKMVTIIHTGLPEVSLDEGLKINDATRPWCASEAGEGKRRRAALWQDGKKEV
jgi:hypothetical protein